jgi:hypothetical protein
MQTDKIREELEMKSDLDWFDSFCDILKKSSNPTTLKITNILGNEKANPKNEIRGSKFLDTFDKRFKSVGINPILNFHDNDMPLDFLGFVGNNFKLNIGDIAERFKDFKIQHNSYDGGTQIFFYPIDTEYEFSAIDCWTEIETENINEIKKIYIKSISFKFGNQLRLFRDGYSMKRE